VDSSISQKGEIATRAAETKGGPRGASKFRRPPSRRAERRGARRQRRPWPKAGQSGRLDLNQRPFGPQPTSLHVRNVHDRPMRPCCLQAEIFWIHRTKQSVPIWYRGGSSTNCGRGTPYSGGHRSAQPSCTGIERYWFRKVELTLSDSPTSLIVPNRFRVSSSQSFSSSRARPAPRQKWRPPPPNP
jgi:hypothetical protein